MKVVVCVKHVPDGRLHIDPGTGRLDRSGPGDLNNVDRYAVEEALRLKDSSGAEVVAVTVGPEAAAETLRTALALGADRGVLATDPGAAGSDLLATSRILARALERETPDLVLFGQQTIDGGGAVLWAAVAELMSLPFVSQAAELTVTAAAATVGRQTEAGDEVLEVSLPAIVSVSEAINEPRYASLKGRMGAKKKPLDVLSAGDLGLGADRMGTEGSGTSVLSVGPPPVRPAAERVEDEATAPERILEFLVEKQLL